MRYLLILLMSFSCLFAETAKDPARIELKKPIENVFLYWNTVYVVPIHTSFGTVFEPPQNYIIQSIILGDARLYAAQNAQNRVVVKKKAPERVSTNMTIILKTPEGISRSLTLFLKGASKNDPYVNSVLFDIPVNQKLNRQIEAIKVRYQSQLDNALSEQEETLNISVRDKTLNTIKPFRFGSLPDKTSKKYKGATFFLDGVVNQGPEAYIYMSTDSKDPHCQVVELLSVSTDEINKAVELVHTYIEKGHIFYIYRTSKFPDLEDEDWDFKIKIWSEEFTISTEMTLGGHTNVE